MTRATSTQNAILLAASQRGFKLFRQNTGLGWAGDVTHLPNGDVLIRDPRPLHAGLCKGSSDLIGWRPLLILPEHVGTVVAQFAAIEVKSGRGRASKEQANFLRVVREAGGVGILARKEMDLDDAP